MRTIAHISDLHFGAHDPAAVAALEEALDEARPDLVVVSGDVTQRARRSQFVEADAFLRRLEDKGLRPLVVPGNHDVPLYDVIRRFVSPLGRYRRLVGRGRAASYLDEEIAVLGLASAHGLTVKHGRLSAAQIGEIAATFARASPAATRLLVTHHPLVPLPGEAPGETETALRGGARALAAVQAADVRLILAGHHHTESVEIGGPRSAADPHILIVQAGTATSWRRRGEPNGFNLLRIARDQVTIEAMRLEVGRFTCSRKRSFAWDASGWRAS